MKGYKKYYLNKVIWYLLTFFVAIVLNFTLPRLMPGNPVSAIATQTAQGLTDATAIQKVYAEYAETFGVNKPRKVGDIINSSIWWTIALQLPAIIVGWILGNVLGAIAAYIRKGFDKMILPFFLFLSNIPAFGMAVILLTLFAVKLHLAPTSGGYGFDLIPSFSPSFILSVLDHYKLPFFSIVLVTIGGQAIGMRSMSIYELNADYVKYSRFLGIKDSKIVWYVFRNAMLPQITGLAMSLGTIVGGALVAEIIFSYPGIGTTLLSAITGRDYPLISACTLIITIMVLVANLLVELLYGLIDPRIKATQSD